VKNEELTYNSNSGSTSFCRPRELNYHKLSDLWKIIFATNSFFINFIYTLIVASSVNAIFKQLSNIFTTIDLTNSRLKRSKIEMTAGDCEVNISVDMVTLEQERFDVKMNEIINRNNDRCER
jgi:hypothetical protein